MTPSLQPRERRFDWAGLALIAIVALGVLYPLWTRSGVAYSVHSDVIAEHLSVKSVGVRAVLHEKSLPLWNPSMNCGAPALANPQAMYCFPFDLLYLILPLDRAVNTVILLNVILAGAAMYLLSKGVFLDRRAAIFCAVAYMLSYRYLAMIHSGWTPKMSMFALAPLAFWAVHHAAYKPDLRAVIRSALVVALVCLQGDMQQMYYAGLGCVVYALILLCRRRDAARVAAVLICGALLGVMLASPILAPQLDYASHSTRTASDYSFFTYNSPHLEDLATFIDPNNDADERIEFWENNFYFGPWLIPLIAAAFVRDKKPAFALILAAAAAIFLCFDSAVLKTLFNYLPGFSLFRQSSRLLLLAQFIIVLTAGYGAARLLHKDSRIATRVFGVASVLTAAAAFCRLDDSALLSICLILLATGVFALVRPRAKLALVCLIYIAPITDAALRSRSLYEVIPLNQALPSSPLHEMLNRDAAGARTAVTSRNVIPYGAAGYYGVDLVNGYASLNLKHYIEYFSVMQLGSLDAIPQHPVLWTDCRAFAKPHLLRALDAKYIATDSASEFSRLGYEHVADLDDVPVFVFYQGLEQRRIRVWRDRFPLGAAYFAASFTPVENETESLKALAASNSALHADVWNAANDFENLDYAGGKIIQTHRGLNRYAYEIDSRGENYLILSQIWRPGWRCRLDDAPVTLHRTNHALIGCRIPAGEHELILEMTSPPLKKGLYLATAALLILVILAVAARPRRRRRV